jgi:HSP20 family protein
MQLVKTSNPIKELRRIERDFDDFWNSGWGVFPQMTGAASMFSALDMYEEDGKLITEVSLPNYKKEEINVRADNGILEISASHKGSEEKNDKRNYYYKENSSKYMRRVMLPDGVRPDNVDATFKDGMLRVEMPIEMQQTKTIAIK